MMTKKEISKMQKEVKAEAMAIIKAEGFMHQDDIDNLMTETSKRYNLSERDTEYYLDFLYQL